MIVPFVVSAIVAGLTKFTNQYRNRIEQVSTAIMLGGFGWLVVNLIILIQALSLFR